MKEGGGFGEGVWGGKWEVGEAKGDGGCMKSVVCRGDGWFFWGRKGGREWVGGLGKCGRDVMSR